MGTVNREDCVQKTNVFGKPMVFLDRYSEDYVEQDFHTPPPDKDFCSRYSDTCLHHIWIPKLV